MQKEELIEEIVGIEWNMFDKVNNLGGRASCQDDYTTFHIMRKSQFQAWNILMLESYKNDLMTAREEGRNLLTEKYAYMMEYTHADEYAKIAHVLPKVSAEKSSNIDKITQIYMRQTEQLAEEYPKYMARTRPIHAQDDRHFTSIETYLRCELKTYSENTVKEYWNYLQELEKTGGKIAYMICENIAKCYGYSSLADAERGIKVR